MSATRPACTGGSCVQGRRHCETPEACQMPAATPAEPIPATVRLFLAAGVAVFLAWICAGVFR